MKSFLVFMEGDEVKNLHPIDELREYSNNNQEFFSEDDNYLVIRPKSHKTSCFYGQYTKSKYCLADEEKPSEWDQIDMITSQFGDPAYFYYVFSKKLSAKNSKSVYMVLWYTQEHGEIWL